MIHNVKKTMNLKLKTMMIYLVSQEIKLKIFLKKACFMKIIKIKYFKIVQSIQKNHRSTPKIKIKAKSQ